MMTRPLGSRQIKLLRQLASPHLFLIVGDKVAESLVRRGLLAEKGPGGGYFQITPTGMRLLADMWDGGKVAFEPPHSARSVQREVEK